VYLTGIRVFVCRRCGKRFPEIPNIVGLHRTIADHLTRKPSPLTGAEFRFLRKELGFKAKDLARYLGTTDVSLSRWETGDKPINPMADRLLRVLYTLQTVQSQRAVEPANVAKAALEVFEKIAPVKQAKPLSLRIPSERLGSFSTESLEELAPA
jgi:putative zinc finger/helix-turn-helix YgiT family protein